MPLDLPNVLSQLPTPAGGRPGPGRYLASLAAGHTFELLSNSLTAGSGRRAGDLLLGPAPLCLPHQALLLGGDPPPPRHQALRRILQQAPVGAGATVTGPRVCCPGNSRPPAAGSPHPPSCSSTTFPQVLSLLPLAAERPRGGPPWNCPVCQARVPTRGCAHTPSSSPSSLLPDPLVALCHFPHVVLLFPVRRILGSLMSLPVPARLLTADAQYRGRLSVSKPSPPQTLSHGL